MNDVATIRVLLVDDHRMLLRGLELLINAEAPAMKVVGTATTIEEACALADELRPDVVVLDLDLGGQNGADAIPRLRANGQTAVLVLTGIRDRDIHRSVIIAGARGVVPKESSAELIVKAIRKVHAGEIWLDRASLHKVVSTLGDREAGVHAMQGPDVIAARLTRRERQIIAVLSANASVDVKKIATMLGISEHTLRHHLSSIYEKVGVTSRLGLYEFTQKHRLA